MTDFQILNSVEHKDVRIRTHAASDLGDALHCCPGYTFEMRDLQANFPILLQAGHDGGFIPVVLLGFTKEENLFLEAGLWDSLVKPAFMRKGPFLIGEHEDAPNDSVRLMSIDVEHPRVGTTEGEALFQPLGGRTDYLETMANLLENIYQSAEHTERFCQRLAELNLVESVTMDITLRDGSKNQLLGFYTINEDRVRELGPEQLGELSAEGFIMPMFMMLASLSNFRRLIDLKDGLQAANA